jgi:CxxC motif-containing protein (DUF1111 family)
MVVKSRERRRRVLRGLVMGLAILAPVAYAVAPTEAPAGFDNLTNGFEPQASMDADRAVFDETQQVADGLGPVFNAQACKDCHHVPVSGGSSEVLDVRAGFFDGTTFTGGSLIHAHAIDPSVQEHVPPGDNVVSSRIALNTLGDGFVEALPDSAFTDAQAAQGSAGLNPGTIIRVPLLEAPGVTRIGRFGWKDQHASLLSFAADELVNEIGLTSPLEPNEATSNGRDVSFLNAVNGVPAIQDPGTAQNPFGADVEAVTRFMRSTKVPPRDATLAAAANAQAGAQIFNSVGCALCHVASQATAPAGTVVNGGRLVLPAALGNKLFHPFSDFLLHDVGTGDGIVQNGGQATRNKIRTPPLWALRLRAKLLHDGSALTLADAILAHAGDATPVINNYLVLSSTQRNQLTAFLKSL